MFFIPHRGKIGFVDLYGSMNGGNQTASYIDIFATLREASWIKSVVINIDSGTAVGNEDELITSMGLRYFHIPVIWTEPKQSDLDLFFDVMKMLKGKRVFIHCAANARVSTFVYLYRVARLGVDPVEAKKDLNALWEPNETWQRFIDEAVERHSFGE